MNIKYIKTNPTLAIFTIIFIIFVISFFSYKYFISSFIDIEKEQNKTNIHSVLEILDNNLSTIEALVLDYAKWDSTYEFIKTKNNDYIDENFREGTNTLEDLKLDFMIFTDINKKIVFETYYKNNFLDNYENFAKNLILKYSYDKNINTIHKNKTTILKKQNRYFFVTKQEITNSDSTQKANGYLITGKEIKKDTIDKIKNIYSLVTIDSNKTNHKNFESMNSKYLKNILLSTKTTENKIINHLAFYNYKNEYIMSIHLSNDRNFVNKSKNTILFYNLIIAGFLFVILFLIFLNQKMLQKYNEDLENKVKRKTKSLKKSYDKLKIISETDELTKIYNRRKFFRKGTKALKKSISNDSDLSILMIDLDNFKNINDTYGHEVGDKVLIDFANKIKSTIHDEHIFGRLGGEEFAIIFVNISDKEAYEISDNLRLVVQNSKLQTDNLTINYTFSSGLAKKGEKTNIDEILKEADEFLYNAKNRGKNCIIRQRGTA